MRLHEDVRKMVAFLGFREMDPSGLSVPRFGGTGFFVAHDGFSYLITARHVAQALAGPFVIGLNSPEGKLDLLDVDNADWTFHEDDVVDVATIPLGISGADWVPFDSLGFATKGAAGYDSVGTGDLVYIVGLYRLFPGREKMLPVVHTGHIAMTPDEGIPMVNRTTGALAKVNGYLVEAQTLEGLSGAPVFVRYTNPTGVHTGRGRVVAYTDSVYLLGLWAGSWTEQAGPLLAAQLGRDARVPVGMGITIPCERIKEVLDSEKLKADRASKMAEYDRTNAASTDAAPDLAERAAAPGENPAHREDFNRLVGAAAKKRPPSDKT